MSTIIPKTKKRKLSGIYRENLYPSDPQGRKFEPRLQKLDYTLRPCASLYYGNPPLITRGGISLLHKRDDYITDAWSH